MKKAIAILLLIIVSSVAISTNHFHFNEKQEKGIETTVLRVIDGYTLQLANDDVVRLIGVDAPEKNHPYHKEALEQLEGKTIRMEEEKTNKDRYGRYLRYVFLDDYFVNLELVKGGLAYVYIVNLDDRYEKEFAEAEKVAREAGIGIWRKSVYSGCVEIESFHYNAKGDDRKNLEDEYFVIENVCDVEIHAKGWSVRNTFNNFQIPEFSIDSGKNVRIISGSSPEGVSISSSRPIWNNRGMFFI